MYKEDGDKWIQTSNMLEAMTEPITTAMCAKLWVVFNTAQDNTRARERKDITLQCFDPVAPEETWLYKASLPENISTNGAMSVGVGDQLLLLGGSDKL